MISDMKNQYFSICRILLIIVGLWPYRQSRFVRLQIILIQAILTSGIMVQFTTLITTAYTMNLIIKILSCTLPIVIIIYMHNFFWIKFKNIRFLLDQLQHTYNRIKDVNEISIIEKYGGQAKRFANTMTLLSTGSLLFIMFVPIYLHIHETFLFREKSSSHRAIQIMTEYFIDQEKYFYLIILHIDIVLCTGTFVTLAGVTLIFVYLRHLCGIFRIASYRVEQTITINMLKNIDLVKNKITIHKKMVYAIDIQRKAMELSTFFSSCFNKFFFVTIAFTVASLSTNFFQIFQIVLSKTDMDELLLHVMGVTGIFLFMFSMCYIGQEITDHCAYVFFTAYNIRWYKAPLDIQKLLLFLLLRGNKIFTLNAGMFSSSLEFFATMASISISYFTVMYSVAIT